MRKLFDVQLPFFIPLWRRIALVGACFGWAVLELALGNPGWAVFFALIGAFCSYEFFVAFNPRDPE